MPTVTELKRELEKVCTNGEAALLRGDTIVADAAIARAEQIRVELKTAERHEAIGRIGSTQRLEHQVEPALGGDVVDVFLKSEEFAQYRDPGRKAGLNRERWRPCWEPPAALRPRSLGNHFSSRFPWRADGK